jgi:tetratricopeptide (TPR) repeat protein
MAPPNQANISPELRGDLAMARQQYLAAIEAYREAPADSAEVWNKLGIAYHHLFAMDEARRNYERALHLRPNYAEALNNLGAVYYAKHSYHKAEKFYKKALHLDPHAASVYSNLGTDYFAERKINEGIDAYRTAFTLDPQVFADSSPALVSESLPARDRAQQDFCLAKLFAQSGHYDRAIDFLRRALNEGFDNRKAILQDQTLASLRSTPEFTELMTEQKLR